MMKLDPTIVYDTYWYFATERQSVFFNKIQNKRESTADPILQNYKFTNAYRASDRVSQYLIKNVIYNGDQTSEEIFFRILLFKIFNKISTWEYLTREYGRISFSEYSFKHYDNSLNRLMNRGVKIYSAAYMMPSGKSLFGFDRKHQNHLKLIELLMNDNVSNKITELKSMQKVFLLLRSYPMLGNFLAYQYAVDLNYSALTNFSEMDFVVAGPGAINGIAKCFNNYAGLTETDIIKIVADKQEEEFQKRRLDFKTLWGRRLHLIDCQNLFCEVDKYSRVAFPDIKGVNNRIKIKQKYKPNIEPIIYWYPPKWNINHLIEV